LIGEREVLREQVTQTSAGGWFSNNLDSCSMSVLPDLHGYLN
jgi:hypothetical protein